MPLEKRLQLRENLISSLSGQFADSRCLACMPVETSDLIGQNRTADGQFVGQKHLEGVALNAGCHGAEDSQARFFIISPR